jgi:hypothetical protein
MKRQKYNNRYHFYTFDYVCMNCEHFYKKMEGKFYFFGCTEMLNHGIKEMNPVDHNRISPFSYCDNFSQRLPF